MTLEGEAGLRQLALRERHRRAGARFVPFAGWEMPLQYTGILAEHEAVRTAAGVFDVSHLGRVRLTGADAGAALRAVTTYDVTALRPGRAHYSLYCVEDGGIADDVFVYRIAEERWLVVQNAANHATGLERLNGIAGRRATVEDETESTVMLAVQGPEAPGVLTQVLGEQFARLRPRQCAELAWRDGVVLTTRTGYTGEDGAECIAEPRLAAELWDQLVALGVTPAGLGARDTLRLEAALPLHGNDIDRATNPYEAGLGFAVTLADGKPFVGRTALERLAERPVARRLSCLRLLERGVPRHGYAVRTPDGAPVATLTSGAFSPTLRTGIGMAYLPVALFEPGTRLAVEVHGQPVAAQVVERPFYRRTA